MADSFTGTHEQAERYAKRLEGLIGLSTVLTAINSDELRQALYAGAAALRAEQGWQPIETAPKDGTQVLLWITGIEPRPRIGFWSERGSEAGWYGLQTQHFIGLNVTHWMPLPSPPSRAEQGRQIEKDHGGTRLTEVDATSVLVPADQLPHDAPTMSGALLIAAERARQVDSEGWTAEHDDSHEGNELLQAAVWYLDNGAEYDFGLTLPPWPWEAHSWKPSDDRVRQLVKAGALIAAEIDRLQRRDTNLIGSAPPASQEHAVSTSRSAAPSSFSSPPSKEPTA